MNSEEINRLFINTIGRNANEDEVKQFRDSGMSSVRMKRMILRSNINIVQPIRQERKVRRKKTERVPQQNTQVVRSYSVNNKHWKDFCRDNLEKIRKFFYLEPLVDSKNHAILSVFEKSECVEFVLRNMLVKLMGNWKLSIVCHRDLKPYIKDMIKDISTEIEIISVSHEKYNKNMLDKNFWKNLKGDKILCMTPDTVIFNENVEDFLHYDYIGAPWKYKLKGTFVGDGKLSLRTRKIMMDILENFEPQTFLSEDVFFSSTMLKHNIGKLASAEQALLFSYKDTKVDNTVGGSMIWRSNNGVVNENEVLEKVL